MSTSVVKTVWGASDKDYVAAAGSTAEQRDQAFRSLLETPDVLISALTDDGFRVPLPASLTPLAEQVISMPRDRATMIDLLRPAEAIDVVVTWERAAVSGMAFTEVHARHVPTRSLTLTFIDMRHRHGVWIAGLTPTQAASESLLTSDLAGALATSLRPRTASMVKSEHAVIVDIDDRASRMLGWTPGQLTGKRSTEFLHPDDHERVVSAWLDLLAKKGAQRVRARHRCADGSWLWVETEHTYLPAVDASGKPTVAAELTDISDEMKAHEDLGRSERLFRRLAGSLPVGLLQIDVQRSRVYANNRLAAIIGTDCPPSLDELIATVEIESRLPFDAALDDALLLGRDGALEMGVRQAGNGEARTLSANIMSLGEDEGVPGALCCFTDVTEGARLREELRAKATFDPLTGCHNRATVMSFLKDHLAGGRLVAVVFVDLDNFKPVNDEHGHDAGDELLVHVARRLMDIIEGHGMTGRLGGDEFLVVATDLTSAAEAVALSERIDKVLQAPVQLSAATIATSASTGVACSRPGEDAKSLVKRADATMYLAKSRRKHFRRATDDALPATRRPAAAPLRRSASPSSLG